VFNQSSRPSLVGNDVNGLEDGHRYGRPPIRDRKALGLVPPWHRLRHSHLSCVALEPTADLFCVLHLMQVRLSWYLSRSIAQIVSGGCRNKESSGVCGLAAQQRDPFCHNDYQR
jgi:hypothetical protein